MQEFEATVVVKISYLSGVSIVEDTVTLCCNVRASDSFKVIDFINDEIQRGNFHRVIEDSYGSYKVENKGDVNVDGIKTITIAQCWADEDEGVTNVEILETGGAL